MKYLRKYLRVVKKKDRILGRTNNKRDNPQDYSSEIKNKKLITWISNTILGVDKNMAWQTLNHSFTSNCKFKEGETVL